MCLPDALGRSVGKTLCGRQNSQLRQHQIERWRLQVLHWSTTREPLPLSVGEMRASRVVPRTRCPDPSQPQRYADALIRSNRGCRAWAGRTCRRGTVEQCLEDGDPDSACRTWGCCPSRCLHGTLRCHRPQLIRARGVYCEYGASCLTPATTRASTTRCHWAKRPTSTAAGRTSISQSDTMEMRRAN